MSTAPTIKIAVSQADATLIQTCTLTAGMQNTPTVKFTFSPEWAGLGKVAVCRAGSVVEDVPIGTGSQITVPVECLETAGVNLIIGVYGENETIAIPTVWCSCGEILDGTNYEEASNVGEATQDLVDAMIAAYEGFVDTAEEIEGLQINEVEVDATGADVYGTASVTVSDSKDQQDPPADRTLTFTFTNLKGNGITNIQWSPSGSLQGTIRFTESNGNTTDFDALVEPIQHFNDVTDEAEASALVAEGYAVGTQDGEPSETYAEINAAYFAGLAATAKTGAVAAKGLAETAQGKAETAQGKAEDAQAVAELAASQASTSASTATSKAADASDYATAAEGFASTAETAASSASSDAEQCDVHEQAAKLFAEQAMGSAGNASNSAALARGYKNDASGSASSASTSASSASTDALKAEGFAVGEQNGTEVSSGSPYYENNAKYYADEAADSATAAAGSASDASDSAAAAATSAATFETDTTLSVSGKAADAKKTGDEIGVLKSVFPTALAPLSKYQVVSTTGLTATGNSVCHIVGNTGAAWDKKVITGITIPVNTAVKIKIMSLKNTISGNGRIGYVVPLIDNVAQNSNRFDLSEGVGSGSISISSSTAERTLDVRINGLNTTTTGYYDCQIIVEQTT